MATKVELVEADAAHPVHREMWVRVLSDEILDWDQVYKRLDPAQKEALAGFEGSPCAFYPNLSADDREGYAHDEWWAFPEKGWRTSAH